MAALLDPKLLDKQVYSKDVNRRVKAYLDEIVSAGSYTASLGIPSVRRNVAEFISKTYKVPKPQI
jgi:aspartate/methionine/tyrosine aminotransferase